MSDIADVLNENENFPLGKSHNIEAYTLSNNDNFGPMFTGTLLTKGNALAGEIDMYRKRIQSLLNFFDCIAPHWWDHLHPFKNNLVKRPSRSADQLRIIQTQLSGNLTKLTVRNMLQSAAAVASIEERDSIVVVPPNLLHLNQQEKNNSEIDDNEFNEELLNAAYNLAHQLAEVEHGKQQAILAAADWIVSDGRDLNLRCRRVAILAKFAEPCLIENFAGIRAILTHYYRPNSQSVTTEKGEDLSNKKFSSSNASMKLNKALEEITANQLTSTNQDILDNFALACPTTKQQFTSDLGLYSGFRDDYHLGVMNSFLSFPSSTIFNTDDDLFLSPFEESSEKIVSSMPKRKYRLSVPGNSFISEIRSNISKDVKDVKKPPKGTNKNLYFENIKRSFEDANNTLWPTVAEFSALPAGLDISSFIVNDQDGHIKSKPEKSSRQLYQKKSIFEKLNKSNYLLLKANEAVLRDINNAEIIVNMKMSPSLPNYEVNGQNKLLADDKFQKNFQQLSLNEYFPNLPVKYTKLLNLEEAKQFEVNRANKPNSKIKEFGSYGLKNRIGSANNPSNKFNLHTNFGNKKRSRKLQITDNCIKGIQCCRANKSSFKSEKNYTKKI